MTARQYFPIISLPQTYRAGIRLVQVANSNSLYFLVRKAYFHIPNFFLKRKQTLISKFLFVLCEISIVISQRHFNSSIYFASVLSMYILLV